MIGLVILAAIVGLPLLFCYAKKHNICQCCCDIWQTDLESGNYDLADRRRQRLLRRRRQRSASKKAKKKNKRKERKRLNRRRQKKGKRFSEDDDDDLDSTDFDDDEDANEDEDDDEDDDSWIENFDSDSDSDITHNASTVKIGDNYAKKRSTKKDKKQKKRKKNSPKSRSRNSYRKSRQQQQRCRQRDKLEMDKKFVKQSKPESTNVETLPSIVSDTGPFSSFESGPMMPSTTFTSTANPFTTSLITPVSTDLSEPTFSDMSKSGPEPPPQLPSLKVDTNLRETEIETISVTKIESPAKSPNRQQSTSMLEKSNISKEETYAYIVYRPNSNYVAVSRSLKNLIPPNTTVIYKVDETSNQNEAGCIVKSLKTSCPDASFPSELTLGGSDSPPESSPTGKSVRSMRSNYFVLNSNLLLKQNYGESDYNKKNNTISSGQTKMLNETAPNKTNETIFVYSTKSRTLPTTCSSRSILSVPKKQHPRIIANNNIKQTFNSSVPSAAIGKMFNLKQTQQVRFSHAESSRLKSEKDDVNDLNEENDKDDDDVDESKDRKQNRKAEHRRSKSSSTNSREGGRVSKTFAEIRRRKKQRKAKLLKKKQKQRSDSLNLDEDSSSESGDSGEKRRCKMRNRKKLKQRQLMKKKKMKNSKVDGARRGRSLTAAADKDKEEKKQRRNSSIRRRNNHAMISSSKNRHLLAGRRAAVTGQYHKRTRRQQVDDDD